MLTADDGLGRELAELTDDCLTIGSQLADAASRLIHLQALPSTELIGRIEALRGDWDDLLSRVSAAAQSAFLTPPNFPGPTVSLTQTIAIAEGTIAACRFEAERVDSRATVFQVLTKVQRLKSQDGSTIEGLAELCHQASVMAKRISESPDPSSLEDYALILEGTHRYCQLLSLIEDLEDRVDERDDLLIECTISLGRQIARAASRRQLCLASDDAIDPPSAPGSAVTDPRSPRNPQPKKRRWTPKEGPRAGFPHRSSSRRRTISRLATSAIQMRPSRPSHREVAASWRHDPGRLSYLPAIRPGWCVNRTLRYRQSRTR
jgi:hypothetical protein